MGVTARKCEGERPMDAVLGPELALHTTAWSFHLGVGWSMLPCSTSPYKIHGVKGLCLQLHTTVTGVNAGLTVWASCFVEDIVPIFKEYLRNSFNKYLLRTFHVPGKG